MFSILVPVYNVEKYLDDCIKSILAQTHSDFEVILADDGSTDSSGQICDEWAKKDDRIKVYHKENSGPYDTRNFAFGQSAGDIILFVDSDDLLSNNALEFVDKKFSEYDCDVVIYDYVRFTDEPIVEKRGDYKDLYITDKKELFKKILSSEKYNSLCIKAIRRRFISSVTSCNAAYVRYGEDLLQTLEVIDKSPKVVFTNEVLYFYRENNDSLTRKPNYEKNAKDSMIVGQVITNYVIKNEVYSSIEFEQYRGKYIYLTIDKVYALARANISYKEKISYYKDIKATEYYKGFLSDNNYDKKQLGNKLFLWYLFKKNMYALLIFIAAAKKRIIG